MKSYKLYSSSHNNKVWETPDLNMISITAGLFSMRASSSEWNALIFKIKKCNFKMSYFISQHLLFLSIPRANALITLNKLLREEQNIKLNIKFLITWSPCACLPMTMGFDQPGTNRGMDLQMMGSLNTVPPNIFLIVPLGLGHIFFSLNSGKMSRKKYMKKFSRHKTFGHFQQLFL